MNSRACDGFGSLRVFDFRRLMAMILVNGAAIHIYDQLCARRRTNIWLESRLNITVWSRRRSRSSFPTRRQQRLETANRLKSRPRSARLGNCVGPKNSFRVFYDVNHGEKTVSVLAIGVKEGNQLFIGGQEFELCRSQRSRT